MSKKNRTCKTCGNTYYFCPTCEKVPATEKYKTMFCSKNCRDIFHTCTRFNVGTIDKATAKSIISMLDLSNRDNFSEQIKLDLSNILRFKKIPKKEIILVEEEQPVVVPVEEPTTEAIEVVS